MNYLKQDSSPISAIKYPSFLVNMDLCNTAKLVYALLFDKAMIDNNSTSDKSIYVIFTIKDLAKTIGKSEMTVKTSLKILEEKGLIQRKFVGVAKPTHIFILYPNNTKAE